MVSKGIKYTQLSDWQTAEQAIHQCMIDHIGGYVADCWMEQPIEQDGYLWLIVPEDGLRKECYDMHCSYAGQEEEFTIQQEDVE